MTERPAKRRRVELSLDDKLKIIKSFESVPKPTLRSLSEKFSIGKSTVGDIIKKREVYKAEFEKNISGNKRRFNNACKFDKLNELIWQWFCQARAKNIPISGPIIHEKASEFAKELAVADFKGSNGWLDSVVFGPERLEYDVLAKSPLVRRKPIPVPYHRWPIESLEA
ncbi:major centromere autoantigen B-like [Gigantopelta aegis]|uniref:major centromere autoantigen B-like n=1 Tax=Gigantopelta aegis TaxID=1735272 RepID=UPI001B88759D|nr:major centromere autoantigen B-like [Gigantopelta aegis]